MCDGNPGEIDFGSSQREVRVSEGSSYRESTVCSAITLGANVFEPVLRLRIRSML